MKPCAKKYHYLANPWFFVLEGGPIRQVWVLGIIEVIFSKYITIPCQKKKLNEKIFIFRGEILIFVSEIRKNLRKNRKKWNSLGILL